VPRIPHLRSLPRRATGAAVLALALGGLTACGGSDSGSTAAAGSTSGSAATSSSAESPASGSSTSSGSGEAEALTATETNFTISLDEDHLKAGHYAITVVNDGNATHNLAVEEDGKTEATSDSIGPGESTTLTVDLDAGKYTFYCSIGNHRAMGMEIDVTVT
jgi:plastocyanin